MNRRSILTGAMGGALGGTLGGALTLAGSDAHAASDADATTKATFDTVMAFMGAMGGGDMDTMGALMADDMVWHNEGDKTLPWIGPWTGKEAIFAFLGTFGANFQVTEWDNTDAFASGDTMAVFGKMNAITTKSGAETGPFTFALRAKVRDGKVVLWHWFEDSFAVSRAYHGG